MKDNTKNIGGLDIGVRGDAAPLDGIRVGVGCDRHLLLASPTLDGHDLIPSGRARPRHLKVHLQNSLVGFGDLFQNHLRGQMNLMSLFQGLGLILLRGLWLQVEYPW